MIVSLLEMPCTPFRRVWTTSAIFVSLMTQLSYHVCCNVEQHEPRLDDGARIQPNFPAVFEVPARRLADLEGWRQNGGKHRKSADQASRKQRILEAVGQIDNEVAEAHVPALLQKLEAQRQRIDARPSVGRSGFDALR